jgi:nucleotide-binding universal stress UspA family protein|tara:strand:- start:152 stop:565 length:414 start_codon:yes stop_codon:yes gene_type:complete
VVKKILVALSGDGKEKNVIEKAVQFADQLKAELSFLTVNDIHAGEMSMMMDAPKKITKENIIEQINDYNLADSINLDNIFILKAKKVDEAISEMASNYDLLVLGHRKVSNLKSSMSDSDDEVIANKTVCPVLIIDKN